MYDNLQTDLISLTGLHPQLSILSLGCYIYCMKTHYVRFLAPAKYCGVQLSPPNEHVVLPGVSDSIQFGYSTYVVLLLTGLD